MAQLVLPYPDFQPNTKIVSAQIDANNAAILNLLNGNLGPDNVLFPFLATGTMGADKSGTATALAQGYNSRDLVLRGSGWDGAAAQDRDIILRQIITGSAAYRLALLKKEGVVETELLAFNQAGAIVASLVPDANGTRALGSAVARWDAFIDALDVTGASSLGAISAIGAVAANILPDANATRGLGSAAARWNAIYGASLDLSGAATLGGSLTVNGTGSHTFAGPVSVAHASTPKFVSNFDNAASGAMVLGIQRQGALRGQVALEAANDITFWAATGAAGAETATESFRILNTTGDVQFAKKALFTAPGAHVYNNVNQSAANATLTILSFNSERFDTDNIHDAVTNNSRLTCQTSGVYAISASIAWAANVTGVREMGIYLNGAKISSYKLPAASSGATEMNISALHQLNVGDYVQVYGYQTSGAALDVQYVSPQSPEFAMVKVG